MQSCRAVSARMSVIACVVALGCASVKVEERQEYEGPRLARPDHIVVYDFAATATDLPPWASFPSEYGEADVKPDELATGRKLGAEVAAELVKDIDAMGLPAVRAADLPSPENGDLLLIGYFTSIDKGSVVKRVVVGFGSGAAELSTGVEGFLKTPEGMRKLGSGVLDSGPGRGPGLAVPLVVTLATANPIGLVVGGVVKAGEVATGQGTVSKVAKQTADEIAKQLKPRFEQQGWI
jgi:hypothetical protein